MAPVIVSLDNLSGEALSSALSQTVPLLAGASSMATTQLQQNFNQLIQSRQTQLTGFSTGEKFVGNRNEWATVFGNRGKQGKTKNVSGYSVGSGGLAFGFDTQFSAETNIGVGFAYANSKIDSDGDITNGSVDVDSYQFGIYGNHLHVSGWQANYQLDASLNKNDSSRSLNYFQGITGVGTKAKGSFNSYVAHAGLGLKKQFNVNKKTSLTPELWADYTRVQTESYTEKDAG